MSPSLCKCGCGRPPGGKGLPNDLADACYRRWLKRGRPEGGPPPPMSAAERNARSAASREARAEALAARIEDEADEARSRERRKRKASADAVKLAAALEQCMAAGDAKGVREVSLRISNWEPVALILAGRASLAAAARTERAEPAGPDRFAGVREALLKLRAEGEADAA